LPVVLFFCLLSLSFVSCSSSEIGESKDVSQETIYQQHSISYTEGDENATIYSQFRFAGNMGTTLVLTKPASLQFDGAPVAVDSAEFEGAFYRMTIPANRFYGNHSIRYVDINKKKFDNIVSIGVFKLVNVPALVSRNKTLAIEFESLPLGPDDHIEITAIETDSTFTVTHSGNDPNPLILIPVEELQRQKGTQFKLAATLYRKMALQESTTEGGKIEIEQALKPIEVKLQ
jgi:hypothetical protein